MTISDVTSVSTDECDEGIVLNLVAKVLVRVVKAVHKAGRRRVYMVGRGGRPHVRIQTVQERGWSM